MPKDTFWTSWLLICFLGGPILLIYLQIAFTYYLIRRHLNAMIDALPNSRCIYITGDRSRPHGWFEGRILITKIAGMIMFPKSYIHLGDFDKDDVANFPPHLKRLMKIEITMLIGSFVWMFAGSILLKFK